MNKMILESTIILYFSLEIVVKYINSDNFKKFLKNNWLKIVLILPFLRIFRVFGFIGNVVRYARFIPYIQKLAKIPKMAKVTKFFILLVLFKLSLINDEERIKKEEEKIIKKK